jgi:magnesium and cobalt transporter
VRPALFVPETLSVGDLLSEMKLKKHFGIVVDEYGGVSGVVTLEDLLEEIVGEIQEEHEAEESPVRSQADGSWLIDAAAHVEELEERFGISFAERDFDTVGGLIVTGFGRVPAVGETLTVQGVEFEVLDADRRRIRLVRARAAPRPDAARAAP